MPNMWHSDGTPAVDPLPPEASDYLPQLRWEPEYKGHGYRGFPITAAEEFTKADMEDLI